MVCCVCVCVCVCRGEEGEVSNKKQLIETSRLIVKESEAVVKMARKVAAACTDKRMKRVSVPPPPPPPSPAIITHSLRLRII